MGLRGDIEVEFLDGRKGLHPTEIYDLLGNICVDNLEVNISAIPEDLGITSEDLVAAAVDVKAFLAHRISSRSAYEDFSTAGTDKINQLAQLARQSNDT